MSCACTTHISSLQKYVTSIYASTKQTSDRTMCTLFLKWENVSVILSQCRLCLLYSSVLNCYMREKTKSASE